MAQAQVVEVDVDQDVGQLKVGNDPIANFKELRTVAIEVYKEAVLENGHVGAAAKAIDHALAGALTEVQDNFFGFVGSVTRSEEGDKTHVDIRLKAGLVQSYFDAVAS